MKLMSNIRKMDFKNTCVFGIGCGTMNDISHLAYIRASVDLRKSIIDTDSVRASIEDVSSKHRILVPEKEGDVRGLIYATKIEPLPRNETTYINLKELLEDGSLEIVEHGRSIVADKSRKFKGTNQYIFIVRKNCVLFYKRHGKDGNTVNEIHFDVDYETVVERISPHKEII